MGRDVGLIFPTASLHRDHSIVYALSHMGKNKENSSQLCENIMVRNTYALKLPLKCSQ